MQNNKQLWLGVLGATLLIPQVVSADISGTIFRDLNGNGIRDVLQVSPFVGEPAVADINVTAYPASATGETGSVTATTDTNGGFSLATATGSWRLEVTGLPNYLVPGAAGATTVLFANHDTANLAIGLSNPADYSQPNPYLVVPDHVFGRRTDPRNANFAALEGIRYDWGNTTKGSSPEWEVTPWQQPSPPLSLGSIPDLGTLYGVAWNRTNNYVYVSAYHKNFVDYGPGGPGMIYRIPVDPATGAATGAPTQWVNVAGFAGNSMSCTHTTDIDFPPVVDNAVMDNVGKCGLGDMDISEDDQFLFAVNLSNKKVLQIRTSDGSLVNSWDFPTNQSNCTGDATDIRPFGLGIKDGVVYVGGVCTRETLANTYFPPDPPDDNARIYVHTLNPSSGTWAQVLDSYAGRNAWYPWVSNHTKLLSGWRAGGGNTNSYVQVPQPMLSDIEFFGDDMILGIRDRLGDMWGTQIPDPVDGTPLINSLGTGDIVCAAPNGMGSYTLESNQTCGNRTASPAAKDITFLPSGKHQFYWADGAHLLNNTLHLEQSFGGLSQHLLEPVAMTSLTPTNAFDAAQSNKGGILTMDNVTGEPTRAYVLYHDNYAPTYGINAGRMAKANGLGDIEALSIPAPLEVGNRIWCDTGFAGVGANNGVQDPSEPVVANATVTMQCDADGDSTFEMSANTTTDASGLYYFKDNTGDVTAANNWPVSWWDSAIRIIPRDTSCRIFVNSSQSAIQSACGNGTTATNANSGGSLLRDSDGVADVGGVGNVGVTFKTGVSGVNNHTYDFGFKNAPVVTFDPPPGPSAFSCPTDVRLATSVQVNGDSQAAGSTGAGVNGLITFDYAATGELAAPFSKATAGQVGSVWGLSYDVSSKKLYAAAFLKRHASFGPNGIGAIYQMDGTSATPTPSLLIDLAANGVDVGTSSRVASSGAVDDPNELPADASQPSWDRDAFAQIGKISLGDIDISADGKTLWAINLKQRELVEINLTNTTVTAKHAITDPGCSNGEFRPWAVKVHDGKVWVGTVCSAETSQQAADLKAYVQAFDGTTFTTATSFALNYSKGSIGNGPGDEKWQPWKDTFTTLASGDFAIYPQPILSDIEFDMDGSLILGFMDRMGHQVGGVNYTPNYPDDDTMIQGQTGGDIIRVCNNGGKYELENNATCSSGSTTGKDNGQGPGNGEYYWGEMWDFNPFNADGGYHQETSFGGLAFKAGSGEIAVTAMNPLNPNANAGGVIWLDNATGGRAANAGVQVYRQQDGTSPYFGKASGMGDVELFCAEAALQPDVSLTKVVDKPTAKRGETVIYTLTLSNTGTGAATGVSVTDSLPAGVVYVSDDGSGAYVASSGVWSVGSLAANTAKTLKITVTVK